MKVHRKSQLRGKIEGRDAFFGGVVTAPTKEMSFPWVIIACTVMNPEDEEKKDDLAATIVEGRIKKVYRRLHDNDIENISEKKIMRFVDYFPLPAYNGHHLFSELALEEIVTNFAFQKQRTLIKELGVEV